MLLIHDIITRGKIISVLLKTTDRLNWILGYVLDLNRNITELCD